MGLTRNAVPSSMMVGSWERQMSTARSQACLGRKQRTPGHHWLAPTRTQGRAGRQLGQAPGKAEELKPLSVSFFLLKLK